MSRFSDLLLSYGPSFYWPLDNSHKANDQTANNRDGVVNGGITIGGHSATYPPILGETDNTCTDFDGTDDRITVVWTGFGTGTAPISFIGWVHRDNDADTNDCIFSKTSTSLSPFLLATNTTTTFDPNNDVAGGTVALPHVPGGWVLLGLTFNPSTDTVRLYLDGQLAGEGTTVQDYAATPANFSLGSHFSTTWPFDGKMGHVAAFSGIELSGNQVTALYEAAVPNIPTVYPSRPEVPALFAEFTFHDGAKLRAGPDESDEWRVPLSIEFSTEMPGGFGAGSVTLARPEGWDPMQGALLASARFYDAAGRDVYLGRVAGMPTTADTTVTVELEGWSKHLEDDSTARVIFVDIDPSQWDTSPSTDIREAAQAGSRALYGGEWAPSATNAEPELWSRFPAAAEALIPWVVTTYRTPPGVKLGSVYYSWARIMNTSELDNYWWGIETYTNDSYTTGTDSTPNLRAVGPAEGTLTCSATTEAAFAVFEWLGAAVGPWPDDVGVQWLQLAVFGRHGLTKRGSTGGVGGHSAQGLFVSDMADYVIDTFCPLLRSVLGGTVEATTFVVEHAAYREEATPRAIIESMMLLGGDDSTPLDWFIYEIGTDGRPNFEMRTQGTYGNDWRLRSDVGATSENAGYDIQERPNGVKVQYSDGSPFSKTVGPVGSGATLETVDLEIEDPNHPANLAGIRKWASIDVGMNSEAGAELVGKLYLAEKNRNEWRGNINQVGSVRTAGAEQPPYMIRAGDRCVVETDLDTRTRYIGQTSYANGATNISISPRAQRFDLLLARLAQAMTGFSPGTSLGTPSGTAPAPAPTIPPWGGPGSGQNWEEYYQQYYPEDYYRAGGT